MPIQLLPGFFLAAMKAIIIIKTGAAMIKTPVAEMMITGSMMLLTSPGIWWLGVYMCGCVFLCKNALI